jgi:hypothetical protein
VTLLFDSHVSPYQVCRCGPRTDPMEWAAVDSAVTTRPCGLAIDGYQLAGERPSYRLLYFSEPGEKAGPKCRWLQPCKHPRTRIVGGNPMGQREKALQPLVRGASVFLTIHPGIRSTHDGTHSDHHEIESKVPFGPIPSWVG